MKKGERLSLRLLKQIFFTVKLHAHEHQHNTKLIMTKPPSSQALQGMTLEAILTELVNHYGWDEMGRVINIRCFTHEPSIKSSLRFLRTTPWAREKVEQMYVQYKSGGA